MPIILAGRSALIPTVHSLHLARRGGRVHRAGQVVPRDARARRKGARSSNTVGAGLSGATARDGRDRGRSGRSRSQETQSRAWLPDPCHRHRPARTAGQHPAGPRQRAQRAVPEDREHYRRAPQALYRKGECPAVRNVLGVVRVASESGNPDCLPRGNPLSFPDRRTLRSKSTTTLISTFDDLTRISENLMLVRRAERGSADGLPVCARDI